MKSFPPLMAVNRWRRRLTADVVAPAVGCPVFIEQASVLTTAADGHKALSAEGLEGLLVLLRH